MLEVLGRHLDRTVWLCDTPAEAAEIDGYYVCAYADELPFDVLSAIQRVHMLFAAMRDGYGPPQADRGARNFAFHGPDCELLHDTADGLRFVWSSGDNETDDNVIMTVWGKDLDEFIFWALVVAFMPAAFESRHAGYVFVVLGSDKFRGEIRARVLDAMERGRRGALN